MMRIVPPIWNIHCVKIVKVQFSILFPLPAPQKKHISCAKLIIKVFPKKILESHFGNHVSNVKIQVCVNCRHDIMNLPMHMAMTFCQLAWKPLHSRVFPYGNTIKISRESSYMIAHFVKTSFYNAILFFFLKLVH